MHTQIETLIDSTAEILDRDPMSQMQDTYSTLREFTNEIVQECIANLHLNGYDDAAEQLAQHFEVAKSTT